MDGGTLRKRLELVLFGVNNGGGVIGDGTDETDAGKTVGGDGGGVLPDDRKMVLVTFGGQLDSVGSGVGTERRR